MELTDSPDERLAESRNRGKEETRSPLGIDLNEVPAASGFCGGGSDSSQEPESETDPVDVVRAIHDNPDPAPGAPAEVPGPDLTAACGACGRPEARELVVVCDGCERGFHLGCVSGGMAASSTVDWICDDCVKGGVRSKLWPLGVKCKLILDINASPPSDMDGEGGEEAPDLRKQMPGDNFFGGSTFGAALAYSNFLYPANGYSCLKASGVMSHNAKMGLKDMFTTHAVESFQDLGLGFPLGSLRSSDSMPFRFASLDPTKVFLQALSDFISERHGVLEEGWHVDLGRSLDGYGVRAVYTAPDGKTFGSMQEVACHLGLTANSNYSCMDTEIRAEGSNVQERLHLPKKRKTARLLINGSPECAESLARGQCRGFPFTGKSLANCAFKSGSLVRATESGPGGNSDRVSEQTIDGLPVQFEDFFVLSLGQVDVRLPYHDLNLIYPVGYRSCWHDKITGSLFSCEVSDGGVSGPVFKVRRSSCTELSIPVASTVLCCPKIGQTSEQNDEKSDGISDSNWDHDSNVDILILLSDPSPPVVDDLTNLGNSHQFQSFESLHQEAGPVHEKFNSPLSDILELRDEIGDIFVEDNSLFAAWKGMSQKLIDVCSEILKQKGTLKFLCKHGDEGKWSTNWDMMDEKSKVIFSSSSKFCSSRAPFLIPSEYRDKSEVGTLGDVLSRWLDQDRFGLDADFVQEMIEHLPGVESCLHYEFLKSRCSYSASATVGDGLLLVKTKGGKNDKEAMGGLSHKSKKHRLNSDGVMGDSCPPPWKPLCSRLPPDLVGDFLQVLELFGRFHEILGLEEPFSLENLEEELITPSFYGLDLGKFEKEVQRSKIISSDLDHIAKKILSSCNESCLVVSTENFPDLVQTETDITREASQSVSHGICFGVVLTKAHISLLQVLISELQSKVAPFVDPSFDSGESRSRRGRKKDADTPLPSKRTKLHMLPVNELTWPELARRYILAVLSMDGNFESAEIAARESGKVFRCLQGDGGLLCGSLTGVAGMEADAMLLAEAKNRIFRSLKRENAVLTIEDDESDDPSAFETNACNGGIPEWAEVLEPVRKLPTNVGTRIRKCVYDALDKNPPEWAKKILEHSISKEVYKGNASGPTKKAVLSLLADVHNGVVRKCEKGTKKKSLISVSDIIMKQCRIVLRRVIAADDEKVFCNLLGWKLQSSSDNDEGILGSPGMVSRPLDFRTIDLRLAVGAYGGSHEAFLEDVRELWNNVCAVYADQPDCVELAETLFQKFESLYEDEVLTLVNKLGECTKSECLSSEMKKDINDVVVSTSDLPKAPWDEGVCKVCGIDRDDDSVLLCDTCDAEYHTYCLNPPLIRIPEGNWYCPSCIVGKRMVQDASESYKLISRQKHRKYQGEVTRVYLEAIAHLAAVMEEKEYWEFSAQQRTLLLKFLSDELLSSALVHQHLEQCAEVIAELQQKLRSLSIEWKNLKSGEEFLAAKVAKLDASMLNEIGEINVKAGRPTGPIDHGTCGGQPQHSSVGEGVSLNDSGEQSSATFSEKNHTHKMQRNASFDSGSEAKDVDAISDESKIPSQESDAFSRLNELPLPNTSPQGTDNLSGQTLENLEKSMEKDGDELSLASNESEAFQLELNTTKNGILHLQESIRSIESQLFKKFVRREFLGSDSGGRLYWLSNMPSGHPCILVDGSISMKKSTWLQNNTDFPVSKFHSPFLYGIEHARITRSPWASYGTDAEIEELVQWLKDNDPKERELRESILSWKESRFWDSHKARSQVQNSPALAVSPTFPVTNATMLLEKKYGPCFELETEALNRPGKKARVKEKEKMYRCQCLEPILPSMNHCFICHKTFSSDGEFEEHNDDKCIPAASTNEESKEIHDSSKGKGNLKSVCPKYEPNARKDAVKTSKGSELSSGLIRYQNEESACPYRFEDICSKFVTNDSNKELVQEIGLIGSNGILSFVPSLSPTLSDSMLMLVVTKEQDAGDEVRFSERPALLIGHRHGDDCEPDMSSKRSDVNDDDDILKSNRLGLRHSEQKKRKSSGSQSIASGFESCCVVPQTSLRPLVGIASSVVKKLKINLLDMDAALPEEALRLSKAHLEHRWAWRAFVKSAERIYELVQSIIVLEDMIKTEYLRNEWWYWSSLSAAAKIPTVSALALRIYCLDAAIMYDKSLFQSDPNNDLKPTSFSDQKPLTTSDMQEKGKISRKSNKKRKELEG